MSSHVSAGATSARDGAVGAEIERVRLTVLLVPDPKVVRGLLTRYASLRIALAEGGRPATERELEDVRYTLCVTMGTRNLQEAIEAADALLAAGQRRANT
ncbi:DUF5133 domain-containing protein [Streptomyces spiralis]